MGSKCSFLLFHFPPFPIPLPYPGHLYLPTRLFQVPSSNTHLLSVPLPSSPYYLPVIQSLSDNLVKPRFERFTCVEYSEYIYVVVLLFFLLRFVNARDEEVHRDGTDVSENLKNGMFFQRIDGVMVTWVVAIDNVTCVRPAGGSIPS